MRYLFIFNESEIENVYELKEKSIYIGRENTNTIIINNRTVSSLHARMILQETGEYILEDLMSTRGTTINSKEIFSKYELSINDIIKFGKIRTLYTNSPDKEKAYRSVFSSSKKNIFNKEISSLIKSPDDMDIYASGTLNEKLADTMNDLFILYEISNTINSFFEVSDVFSYILKKLLELFELSNAVIILNENDNLKIVMSLNDNNKFKTKIIERSRIEKKIIVSNFKNRDSYNKAISAVSSPLLKDNEILGYIYFETENKYFSKKNISFINAVSSQLSLVIEKEKLMVKITENAKIKKEIDIARSIQNDLLPDYQVFIPGLDIYSFHSFAETVGGDNYFVYKITDKKYIFFILDAAGKGMQGSLISIMVKSALSAAVLKSCNVSEILNICNKVIYNEFHKSPDNQLNLYATVFLGIYDIETSILLWSNAGHEFPFIIRDNNVEILDKGSFPLGWVQNVKYKEYKIKLYKNDIMLLFSDGLIETNLEEKWNEKRIIEILKKNKHLNCNKIVNKLVGKIENKEEPQYDDITIIALKKLLDTHSFFKKINSNINEFKEIEKEIEHYLNINGVLEDKIDSIMIALYESVVNAIRHGNLNDKEKKIGISINKINDHFKVCITDKGKGFCQTKEIKKDMKKMIEKGEIKGRGLTLIKQCSLSYYYYIEKDEFNFIMEF